jgi:hypothetical protein
MEKVIKYCASACTPSCLFLQIVSLTAESVALHIIMIEPQKL